jgi:hypothetical protein
LIFTSFSVDIVVDGVVVLEVKEAGLEADLFLKDWGRGWSRDQMGIKSFPDLDKYRIYTSAAGWPSFISGCLGTCHLKTNINLLQYSLFTFGGHCNVVIVGQ